MNPLLKNPLLKNPRTRFFHHLVPLSVLSISACVTAPAPPDKFCESAVLLVDAMFEGGNFHYCTVSEDNNVAIFIKPEDEPPINESPWYSFRVSPKQMVDAKLTLTFIDGYARYWPKISADGQSWKPMQSDAVTTADDGKSYSISVSLKKSPVWISAQERLLPAYYDEWIRELAARFDITTQIAGRSAQGRPIHIASSGAQSEVLLLLGRQHPPEVSGAFAMRSFVSTVLGDSLVARRFRRRFAIVIVPLINPDGVALGHWRHNVNGVDLNRDWGPFTQPETQSVEKFLSKLEEAGRKPALMLDFHSTRASLFYTQMPAPEGAPTDFASVWLNRSRGRLPNFEFKHDPRPPSGQENTKNFFFSVYGIPAITYEIGDEADRQEIARTTPVFAEEMMRLMLER